MTARATIGNDVAAQPARFHLHAKNTVAVVRKQIVALILAERDRREIAFLDKFG
jgi:hypothetical protein